MDELKLGRYRHYKGGVYEVIGIARHSETHEELVVYHSLNDSETSRDNPLWVRPKKMFLETVIIDGSEVPRFKYVE